MFPENQLTTLVPTANRPILTENFTVGLIFFQFQKDKFSLIYW
jgi:hypothetical protein